MSKFKYKKRSKDSYKKRADQQNGQFDSAYKPNLSTWTPKAGDHRVRFLPPTWEDAEHYGIDVWLHSSIGANDDTYVCLAKHGKGKCPICEEEARARRQGDTKYADNIKPYRRVLAWVIVRDKEDDGPVLWPMPWTVDRDITLQCLDKTTGEVLAVDDPEDGYDVDFTRDGSGMKTKYVGIGIARRSSPLAEYEDTEDEWLDAVTESPLPDCLNFYEYDYIKEVLLGGTSEEAEEEAPPPRRSSRRSEPEEEEEEESPPPRRRRAAAIDDEEESIDDPPRRRRRAEPEEEEEEPAPRRRSRRSEPEEEEEEEEKPRRRRRRQADDEEPDF